MKRALLCAFALLIAVSFVATGYAEEKAKAPEKPAAAAPEKPAAAAPEKPAEPEKAPAAEKPAKPKPKPRTGFVGEVANVDAGAKLFTVKSKKDTVSFDLANAKFKGYKSAADIKAGDKVVVKYVKDGIKVERIGGKKPAKIEKPAKAKKAAFKDVDKNSDGKITIEELTVVFISVTPDQFKALDKNSDGALDESEYKGLKAAN